MNKLFKKILCPVSFDENSIAALDLACELAEGRDATIYLMHVVPTTPIPPAPIPMEPFPPTEHAARAKLLELGRDHLEGKVKYEIHPRSGDPAREIIAAIDEFGVDSVVMATHGRKGVSHFLLGSVAERVVRESPRPVLTIKGASN